MKYLYTVFLLITSLFSDAINLDSFSANFTQTITDEKGKLLIYKGSLKAKKPQYAAWNYTSPVEKNVYINANKITIVEPELEQVIIKSIENKFDFFSMIKDAKKIAENLYVTHYRDTEFKIKIENSLIESITYRDEFENEIVILFTDQLQNGNIDLEEFTASYPLNYDIIRG